MLHSPQTRGIDNAHCAAAPPVLDFAVVYDRWFPRVLRWVRAMGGPAADCDDIAQEVFLVVRRRLADAEERSLPAWLRRITARQVQQHRRRQWFKTVFSRATVSIDDLPNPDCDPAIELERKEKRALVWRLLLGMTEKRRAAFLLFELEGWSGEEIARSQHIPLKTVWTRLHHARKDFHALLDKHERRQIGC